MNDMSMTPKTQVWIEVCTLEDIPPQGARVIRATLGCVALFRTATDKVFALEDRCPHKGGPLSQGIVHDASVTCPLHNMVFSLESGIAAGPDEGRVRVFAVRVDPPTGAIELSLDEPALVLAAE
tara:strand:- start:54 stop:425 length:372 start_codon:yes stop_codon:yes gene_type:complete